MRFLALLLLASPALADPSMNPEAWIFEHSVGMPAHPIKFGQGWAFAFPTGARDVDYLTAPAGVLMGGKSITVSGKIVTDPGVHFFGTDPKDTGNTPPSFHLFIQARGDQCLCNDFGRWWSVPQKVDLENGTFRLRVALKPSAWQSVFGHMGDSSLAARRGFLAVLARPFRIGVTFGEGNNFGHGVRANGKAVMVMAEFHIDR